MVKTEMWWYLVANQTEAKTMQDVVLRMRRVSADLRAIRKRLDQMRAEHGPDHRVLDEALELDLIRDFKSSIDEVRSFLWEYFQDAASRFGSEPDHALEQLRLRRATELLRSMQDEVVMPNEHPVVQSLFERLQQLADSTVERHFSERGNGK